MFFNPKFLYKGIESDDYDVFLCQVGKSNITGNILSQTLNSEKSRNNNKSSLYDINKENLRFSINVTSRNWTNTVKNNILKWFCDDEKTYHPFISRDDETILYYSKQISIDKTFFQSPQGYLTIDFECNAPWGFKLPQVNTYNISSSPTTITINNPTNCVKYYYPEIEITLNGTSVSLKNKSLDDETMSFSGLTNGETIYLNAERQEILSSLGDNVYRCDKHNGIFLRLIQGNNQIEVTGQCTLKIKTEYPILTL